MVYKRLGVGMNGLQRARCWDEWSTKGGCWHKNIVSMFHMQFHLMMANNAV